MQEIELIDEKFENDTDRLDKYKRDLINDAEDLSDQRDKANQDMRFLSVPGGMWEDFLSDNWSSRTKLEFDLTSEYIYRFLGEWNMNRMNVLYKPDDHQTSDKDAELLNGVFRADFRDESGKMALDNAIYECIVPGYGCLKLGTKFVDEEDPTNEMQKPEFRPIHNAYNAVYWDRAAKRIDKRDARRCLFLEPFTPESFKQVYGEDEIAVSAYTPHTRSYNDFSIRTKSIIYIAHRYSIVRKRTKFHIYSNIRTGEAEGYSDEDHKLIQDELKASEFHKKIRTRVMVHQTVEKSTFSGEKFLSKPKRIPGKYIPIIPFYAYRTYVDGIERWHGMVRKLMDPQRLYNMQVSQLAENSATNGQEVPIFDPDQIPNNIANLWANRNNKPYMLAKSLVDPVTGQFVQHGPLGYLKPAQLDSSTQHLLQIVPQHFQQVTGGAPQDTLDPDASGKAINALIKRENMKTQTIMDNIASSIEWMGEVYQSIASEVYNTRRMVRTIGVDGNESQVVLFKEIMDAQTGKMIQSNKLTGKKFKAYADVGPQYETLREQTVEDIKGMLELLLKAGDGGAKYFQLLTMVMLENINGVGLDDLKKAVRNDMILQGIREPETDEEKQMLQQALQAAGTPQGQEQLVEALTNQALSEGAKFRSEARNLDSKSVQNVADARKKSAETRKILQEIGMTNQDMMRELLAMSLQRAEDLPFTGRRAQSQLPN